MLSCFPIMTHPPPVSCHLYAEDIPSSRGGSDSSQHCVSFTKCLRANYCAYKLPFIKVSLKIASSVKFNRLKTKFIHASHIASLFTSEFAWFCHYSTCKARFPYHPPNVLFVPSALYLKVFPFSNLQILPVAKNAHPDDIFSIICDSPSELEVIALPLHS